METAFAYRAVKLELGMAAGYEKTDRLVACGQVSCVSAACSLQS